MKVLIFAEFDANGLKQATLCTITAAKKISDDITLLLVGTDSSAIAEEAVRMDGITKVLCNHAETYNNGIAESIALLIADVGKAYTHILAPATTYGKNILPRVAALLDVMQISEIISIIDPNTFVQPLYAGNILATVQSSDPIKVITVRLTAFEPISTQENRENKKQEAVVEQLTQIFEHPHSRYVDETLNKSSRPELTSATIIVSGGRGLQNKENFAKLIIPLADKLNAAVGASRAAVDAGFIDNDCQVGQTGKIVAPDLYIAVGISGAIQHLAGMKDSKVVVAINKDAESEMMKFADYALVGDLFEVLPELIEKL